MVMRHACTMTHITVKGCFNHLVVFFSPDLLFLAHHHSLQPAQLYNLYIKYITHSDNLMCYFQNKSRDSPANLFFKFTEVPCTLQGGGGRNKAISLQAIQITNIVSFVLDCSIGHNDNVITKNIGLLH